jgi:hypothetical protein
MSDMFTIKVLLKTLPGGYKPILDTYNANRPEGSEPIREAGVCEGGFEIPLNIVERTLKSGHARTIGRLLDANDYVRQLRWSRGKLQSGYHNGFNEEEVLLLYNALVHVLGKDNVEKIPYEN